jgi:hypothetical protein
LQLAVVGLATAERSMMVTQATAHPSLVPKGGEPQAEGEEGEILGKMPICERFEELNGVAYA